MFRRLLKDGTTDPIRAGEMAERFKAHDWKSCWGGSPSGVRIPLSPPDPTQGFDLKTLHDFSSLS